MAKNIKELTLKWVMTEDKIVRFVEIEEPVEMVEAVAKLDFEKAGLITGAKVTVEFSADNKSVLFLTLTKGATQPQATAPKAQETPAGTNTEATPETTPANTKIGKVAGIGLKYKGITFGEKNGEKDIWYDVVEEIGIENLGKLGISRGTEVEVIIGEPEGRSKNQRIIGIKPAVKKEEKTTQAPDGRNDFDKEKPTNSEDKHSDVVTEKDAFFRIKELERTIRFMKDEKQISIEAQGAVQRGFELVSAVLAKEPTDIFAKNEANIKGMLKTYSQEAFNLIQELKKPKS